MTWQSRTWDLATESGEMTVSGAGTPTVDRLGLHLAGHHRRRHRAGGSPITAWLPLDPPPRTWTCASTARLIEGALSLGLRVACRDGPDLLVLFTPLRQRLAIVTLQGERMRCITSNFAECDAFCDVDLRVTYTDHRVRAAISNASASRIIETSTTCVPTRLGLAVLDGHASFSRVGVTDLSGPDG